MALELPIQKATVWWQLAWKPSTLAAHRARLLTVVANLACLRVNEVARLQVCNLWFDYLMSYGVPGFEGTCSVHINRRKNDTQRKGHYPALGHPCGRLQSLVLAVVGWRRRALCCARGTPAAAFASELARRGGSSAHRLVGLGRGAR